MINTLFYIILATFAVSLISFVGILFSYNQIKKLMHYFITFAAATLLAAAFFDLIPDALGSLSSTNINPEQALAFVFFGIVLFFLMERFIHWHHCDKDHCEEKPAGILTLAGDFVHNFFDGLLIAAAFVLNTSTGMITTLTVIAHEIPHEFGNFAVLIHSGFAKNRALFLNFISALTAILGGILGFFMFDKLNYLSPFGVLIAAGGFLYVALSDIVPELHHHHKEKRTLVIETIVFMLTLAIAYIGLGLLHAH